MRLEVRTLLEDMRLAGERIERFVAGRSREDYLEDEMLRSAVERQFEIIGEAVNRLTRLSPDTAESLPDVHRIIAFRNILAHGYDVIDPNIVWDVVEGGLPPLMEMVRALLSSD
jgi:uncharacterized protein with HEPN domain